jgi:hypothetical protein
MIPPGEYDVAASVIGYAKKILHVVVQRGKPAELVFRLKPTPYEVQEFIVTAPRQEHLPERHLSIHMLKQEEVKLVPVSVQEDVFQSMKILPGIVTTNDVSSRFFVRGGAADENLVLLDGVKIFSPFHAMGVFSIVDPDILQHVELSAGAFPPEYGGRLSSVVSISTRDGRSDRLAGRASLNFLSSKVQLEGPALAGTTWLVNARRSTFSQTFKRLVNQELPVSFYDALSKFNVQFPGGAKLDFSFLASSDRLDYSQSFRSYGRTVTSQINHSWNTTLASASFSHLIGERTFIRLSTYFSRYKANRDSLSGRTFSSIVNTIRDFGLRAVATYYTNSQDLCMFGFDFGFPTVQYRLTNISGRLLGLEKSFVDGRAWLRYQIHADRWMYDVGIHNDFGAFVQGELGLESFQPRINVSHDVSERWKLNAALALCSQRMITVNNEDEVMSTFDTWMKNPDGFGAEKAAHIALGAKGNLSDATALGIESYYKHYSSLIVYNREKMAISDPDYVMGSGRAYGVELLLRSRLSEIDLYGAYTLAWTRIRNSGLEYFPQYDRRHTLNVMATAHPFRDLEVTVRWQIGSGFPFTANLGYYDRLTLGVGPGALPFQSETGQPYLALGEKNAWRLPAYHRLDLSASYRFAFGGMQGSLGLQLINVYDRVNVFYFSRYTGTHVDQMRFFPSATMSIEY